jgi:hemoglobin
MAPPDDTPRSLAAGTEEAQHQEATSTKKESSLTSSSESLFERLGGSSAVKSVVDDFYTRCIDDPYLAKFFDTSKLSALKYHQLKFLKVAFTKIPDDLDVTALMLDKHRLLFRDRGLNASHFDKVCLHLVASLDSAGATPELIDEAANILLPLRPVFELGEQKYGAGSGSDASSEDGDEEGKVNAAASEPAEPTQYGSHAVLHSGASGASSTAAPQTNENRATLSDRLGGNDALRAAVAGLYQKILDDDELSIFFQDVNMTALKLHQIEFLKVAFGQVPDGLDVSGLMLSKHRRLFEAGLNEMHFDRVAAHLVATLADLNVPEALIDEAVGIVGPLRAVFEQGALEAQIRAKQ